MLPLNGFLWQFFLGTLITLKIAVASAIIGIMLGLIATLFESMPIRWLRRLTTVCIFIIRGLPELLILFFIYFGLTAILSQWWGQYVEINTTVASIATLSLIFAAYASQVFKGAFAAIPRGQIEAAKALGFKRQLIFTHIEIPQAWRHALPGLGNLWLVLLKDTAIVMLIGLQDLLGRAKLAANATNEPFTYYAIAALIYLLITTCSQIVIRYFTQHANRYIQAHDQLYT